MTSNIKRVTAVIVLMTIICGVLIPSIKFEAEELTSSKRTEQQLDEIINTYGEENIIFENGISLYVGEEIDLSEIITQYEDIEFISNDESTFEVRENKLVAVNEGVTFLIAKSGSKYHVIQVYVASESISTFASEEKQKERASRGYYVVYVDAGHGGKDPGTVANGVREKDLNLTIASKVRDKLKAKGVSVVMNRESDVFIDFKDTAAHANKVNPDVFVSIHNNSSTASSANGIETFYSKQIDVAYGKEIHNRLISNTGAYDRGLKKDTYYVTNHTVMPAVLVECGFLTNSTEVSKLKTDAYQEKIVNAIVDGAMKYLTDNIIGDTIESERIFGRSRFETSYQIFENGWASAETAILVTGMDYPDALSAAPLAGKYNAPILLVQKKSLEEQQELKNLLMNKGVKKVYIIGGELAISSSIESELNRIGITSKRLSGRTRYDTSVAIAKELGSTTGEIAIAYGNGFADGLSISSIAAAREFPILLCETNYIPDSIKSYINDNNVTKSYIIGSEGVISNNVANQLPGAERLGGRSRYDTNLSIFNRFKNELNLDKVYLSSGLDFPDALSSSALAAKENTFVILTHTTSIQPAVSELFNLSREKIGKVYVLGSSNVIGDSVLKGLGIR